MTKGASGIDLLEKRICILEKVIDYNWTNFTRRCESKGFHSHAEPDTEPNVVAVVARS